MSTGDRTAQAVKVVTYNIGLPRGPLLAFKGFILIAVPPETTSTEHHAYISLSPCSTFIFRLLSFILRHSNSNIALHTVGILGECDLSL
jgi:hypothetical protein